MKKTISKDTIILIALIYNYLANNETELVTWKFPGYIEAIKTKLEKINSEYRIVNESSLEEKYELNKYFEKNEINKIYKLFNLNNIESWYLKQPKEIIHVALDKNILPIIYAENIRYKIPNIIIEEYEPYKGYREVSCLGENAAKYHLTRILEYELAKNIVIESVEPIPKDNKKGFNVYFTCDRLFEKIDVSAIHNKIKKLTEKMDSLKIERTKLQEERKGLSDEKVSTIQGIFYALGIPAIHGNRDLTKDKQLQEKIKKLSNQIDEIDITLNGKKEPYHYIKDINSYLIEEKTKDNDDKHIQSYTPIKSINKSYEEEKQIIPLTRKRTKDE